MITETGRVIAIKEVQGELIAQVECISKSACSSCNNQTSCGVGVVAQAFSDKSQYIELPFKEGMKIDHYIELQVSNGNLIKSASLIYLLPLFFFIGTALTLKLFFTVDESILILISLLSSAIGFLLTHFIAKKLFPIQEAKALISADVEG